MKLSEAAILHRNVPPDWYQRGIKENIFQRFWHLWRFKNISKLIEPSGGKILDIGCADGTATNFILKYSKANLVLGIDILPASVNYARKRFKSKKLKFLVSDAERLPFEKEEFDAVFCLDTIEHLFNPQKVMAETRRVLKKNGYFVILIHTGSPFFRIVWFFGKILGVGFGKAPTLMILVKNGLREMITRAGFKDLKEKSLCWECIGSLRLKSNEKHFNYYS